MLALFVFLSLLGLYERQWNAYNTKSNRVCFRFIWKCRLRHRGPDWSGLHCHGNCYLAHQRLAIVDPTSGDQPLYNEDKTIVVTVFSISINLVTLEFSTSVRQSRWCQWRAHVNVTNHSLPPYESCEKNCVLIIAFVLPPLTYLLGIEDNW